MIDETIINILNKECLDPNAFTELNFINQESFCDYDKVIFTITQRNTHWRELLRRVIIQILESGKELEFIDSPEDVTEPSEDILYVLNNNIYIYDQDLNQLEDYINVFLEKENVSTARRELKLSSNLFYDSDSKLYKSAIDGKVVDSRDRIRYTDIQINQKDLIYKNHDQIKIPIKLVEDWTQKPIPNELLYIEVLDSNHKIIQDKAAVLSTNKDGEVIYLRDDFPTQDDLENNNSETYDYYFNVYFLGGFEEGYYNSSVKTMIKIKR